MALFVAINKKRKSLAESRKKQQKKKQLARKQMASKSNQNKKKRKPAQNKEKSKHKFSPSLPKWPIQQKKYIEQQLSQWGYFKKRPRVYPCDNFESFVETTIQTLESKGGDFCWSMDWDPLFMSQLIYNGFLTISSELQQDLYVMLPKLHQERCVIDMDTNSKTCHLPLVCSKSTKKRSKNYTITIDQCFERVLFLYIHPSCACEIVRFFKAALVSTD